MEARARAVAPRQRDERAARRTDEQPAHGPDRIAVLAQDVADTGSLSGAEQVHVRLLVVDDDQVRVVLDAGPRTDRAHQVLGLLARRPGCARAEPELLVKAADHLDHGGAEE